MSTLCRRRASHRLSLGPVGRSGRRRPEAPHHADQERVLAASRDELIRSHLGLVMSIAKQYTGRGVAFMDLVSEGNTGLVRAASRFQPERGVRFATYAYPWIEHAVRAACLRQGDVMSVPPGMMRQVYAFRRLMTKLGPGREVSAREVSERLGITVEAASAVISASTGLKSATGQVAAAATWTP
jgi:RNA polymerase primary sigma factor